MREGGDGVNGFVDASPSGRSTETRQEFSRASYRSPWAAASLWNAGASGKRPSAISTNQASSAIRLDSPRFAVTLDPDTAWS
jgi:hypothetical protein